MNQLAHVTGVEHTENNSLYHWIITDGALALLIILISIVIAVTIKKFAFNRN